MMRLDDAVTVATLPVTAGTSLNPGDRHIRGDGLARPPVLDRAATLLPTLSEIVGDWSANISAGPLRNDPFVILRPLSAAR